MEHTHPLLFLTLVIMLWFTATVIVYTVLVPLFSRWLETGLPNLLNPWQKDPSRKK